MKQGLADCLNRVLRDFSRPKTSRLNLKSDQRKIQRYITKRVKHYIKSPSPDLGDPGDPVTLISLLFDVEYEGNVDLIFDTRPNAAEAFEFVEGTEHCLELFHWNEAVERFACDGLSLMITLQDGNKVVVEADADGDEFDNYIGGLLRDILIDMQVVGTILCAVIIRRGQVCRRTAQGIVPATIAVAKHVVSIKIWRYPASNPSPSWWWTSNAAPMMGSVVP